MTHATSLRTVSLSLSTAFWVLLLAAMMAVGPRVAQFVPRGEPILIEGVPFVEPPPPDVQQRKPTGPRVPEGIAVSPAPALAPVEASPELAPIAFAPVVEAAPPTITHPVWLRRPSARELAQFYPLLAIKRERSGAVSLNCLVRTDGALVCQIASENPEGYGFGRAALRISETYRMAPATRDGRPVEARYQLRVPFELH